MWIATSCRKIDRWATWPIHAVVKFWRCSKAVEPEVATLYDFTKDTAPDLEQLRTRLRKMNDDQLLRFGRDARYMCSPKANMGKPPLQPFLIQLQEARAEWRRRHPVEAASNVAR
jgi:hypothetical protein